MTAAGYATAPAKIMLAGEYAVLDGANAVLMALSPRVCARQASVNEEPASSPLVDALAHELQVQETASNAASAVKKLVIDSTAFYQSGSKLGLGSSAAVAVAACAAALPADAGKDRVFNLAFDAHCRMQEAHGHRGSGADIACATFGGTVAVTPSSEGPPSVEALPLPMDTHFSFVWMGQSASTPRLSAQVATFANSQNSAYTQCMAALAQAAVEVREALRQPHSPALISALRGGYLAIAQLSEQSGLPIVLDAHHKLASMAEELGGACKPTGAGGGDIALAAFPGREAKTRFDSKLTSLGFSALPLGLESQGVLYQTDFARAAGAKPGEQS